LLMPSLLLVKYGLRGGEGVKGARVKGWGNSYQARERSGWSFTTMSKKLTL
jgi:hypothetical protein